MSILKLIAILGILLGAVSFGVEIRQKNKASKGIFVALIIMSAVLFFVAGRAQNALEAQNSQNAAPEAVEKTIADKAEVADADAAVANADDEDDNEFDLTQEDIGDVDEKAAENDAPAADPVVADVKAEEKAADPVVAEVKAEEKTADPVVVEEKAEENAADPVVAEVKAEEKAAAPVANGDPALAPTADAGKDIDDGKVNESIAFSAKKSKKNPQGADIQSYHWDFGDGSSADEMDVKHAYAEVGNYEAKLTVTDKNGNAATVTRKIAINRPESKIKFVSKKLENVNEIKSTPDPVTGVVSKKFEGSHLNLEASGFMLASEGCACELSVSIQGPGCSTTKAKSLKDGGEGELTVKTSCKGGIGDHTWTVNRKVTGNCACTFTGISVDGFEN